MYKPYSDSTLMKMTKKELIEQLRIAEYNYFAAKEAINQQAGNVKDRRPVICEQWKEANEVIYCKYCSVCGYEINIKKYFDECPNCGAYMNWNDNNG